MRSKSTLLLVAVGCLGWYAANREAIEAQSRGEAGTYDLWWPFIIWFALAALVRAIYRQISDKTKAEKPKPKPQTPVASAEAGTSRPKTPQAQKKKALQAAKAKYEETGSMADYQYYLKLKHT